MPLTPGFGRTFRRFGRYPTVAGEETSRTLFRDARGHTSDHLPTQSVVFGRRSAIKPNRAPQTGARHQLTPSMPVLPLDRAATASGGPEARPAHNTARTRGCAKNEMFGENSRDRKDFLVATSKAPSSSSAPQGARRPPLPPGGGRLVSRTGTRVAYDNFPSALSSTLPASALLTGQPSLAMPTSSSNFA
jgi:hypothetical protein